MTVRLAGAALDNWPDLDGYAAANGMPELAELSLDRFCNFVWYMFTSGKEDQDKKKFRAQLWQPPTVDEEVPDHSPWSGRNETQGLSALKRSMSGR